MKSHIDVLSQSEDNLTFIGAAYIMRFGNGNRLLAKVIPIISASPTQWQIAWGQLSDILWEN